MAPTELDRSRLPLQIHGETSLSKCFEGFRPRADITYRSIEDIGLKNVDLHQSLLTGSILRNCTFDEVSFARCDLDGVRFERCSFRSCDFTNDDIRSTTFAHCLFDSCKFTHTYFHDCAYDNTSINACSFDQSVATDCTYTSCRLSSFSLATASFTNLRFFDCDLDTLMLGDCTFLYIVFRNSRLRECTINVESIGYIFGLNRDQIEALRCVYLGQPYLFSKSTLIGNQLLDLYSDRLWQFGYTILALNLRVSSRVHLIGEYVRSLCKWVENGRLVHRDELSFFVRVLRELEREHGLPLLCCAQSVELIGALVKSLGPSQERAEDINSLEVVQHFAASLYVVTQDLLEHFEENRVPINSLGEDFPIEATVLFSNPPEEPVDALMMLVAKEAGLVPMRPSQVIESGAGSYWVVVQTTLLTLVAFQMFLFLINGCVVQITELQARVTTLRRKRLSSEYRDLALGPRQHVPEMLRLPLTRLLSFAGKLPWLSSPDLRGLDNENVKQIELSQNVGPQEPETNP